MRRGVSICYAEERFAPQIELYSWRPPAIPGSFSKGTQVKNIFVGNLDFATNESDLRALFEPYGAIEAFARVRFRGNGQQFRGILCDLGAGWTRGKRPRDQGKRGASEERRRRGRVRRQSFWRRGWTSEAPGTSLVGKHRDTPIAIKQPR
jgi:hypothetical protein